MTISEGTIIVAMPSLRWGRVKEIQVPFLFKIMTLELICEYLKIPIEDLFEESTIKHENMSFALLWCGYLAACKDNYKRPTHTEKDAKIWDEYMKKSSRDQISKGMADLFGSLTKSAEKEEESVKKK
jgi:hypothetical protein